ncbi:MAG: carboxypeptidase-like regulatory domain-containing protein [Bryobacteraceae bacterium]|nr:carboxypeptidase-like regulatory domain-containing protein [Bryobacteraceae bacterium]
MINAIDGAPLAGARVALVAPYGFGGDPLYTKTNAEGRFEFPPVAFGSYALNAERPGFLRTHEPRGPRDEITLVDLVAPRMVAAGIRPQATTEIPGIGSLTKSINADGALHATLVISLTPYAVIEGTVTEPSGLPRSECPVEILARSGSGFTTVLTVQTDDRGQYRAARLAPGKYYVMAVKSGDWTTTLRAFRNTFYRQAIDTDSATALSLSAGEEAHADIRILTRTGVTVAGTIAAPFDASGATIQILLYQKAIGGRPAGGLAESTGGQFAVQNVMPGGYALLILARAKTASGEPGPPLAAAYQRIAVSEETPARLAVELRPLRDLSGVVAFAPGCVPVPVRIRAEGRNVLGISRAEAIVNSAGEFVLSGLTPAEHRLIVDVSPRSPVSARLGNDDALKDGFFYPAPEQETLRVTVGCPPARGSR